MGVEIMQNKLFLIAVLLSMILTAAVFTYTIEKTRLTFEYK
ncbi:hypothetical protein HMPREF0083_04769 [Aneurinibacillus aneurinilyticus ATCC 12856]|uniref:Uncharacterized protein n=1 Tax=Aneurinibacillus aneurinilyticus ATCC 12856 TaxID=649747 RepID=U1Y8F4_ANEAE|nr:hypothetical protein HMPREF0083_04769 [Aneurinibacillus aneurinilyticus ATCC 12856]